MALASNVWTNLLGRENPHVILNSGAVPVLDVTRRAGIRLDVAAHADHLKSLCASASAWHLFLFLDASPQWRGRELWAATMNSTATLARSLVAVAGADFGLQLRHSSKDKVHALPWQLALVAGPDYDVPRQVLLRVHSVTMDPGVEFQLRVAQDCLATSVVPRGVRSAVVFPGGRAVPVSLLRRLAANCQRHHQMTTQLQ